VIPIWIVLLHAAAETKPQLTAIAAAQKCLPQTVIRKPKLLVGSSPQTFAIVMIVLAVVPVVKPQFKSAARYAAVKSCSQ
jgi:hypothetical protein